MKGDNRVVFLENYLKTLGYKFTKETVKATIAKLRKRKPGSRPEKINRVNPKTLK